MTCSPRASASRECSKCSVCGEVTTTASSGCLTSSSADSVAKRNSNLSRTWSSSVRPRRHTAESSTSSRWAMTGIWFAVAHQPAPMNPRRTLEADMMNPPDMLRSSYSALSRRFDPGALALEDFAQLGVGRQRQASEDFGVCQQYAAVGIGAEGPARRVAPDRGKAQAEQEALRLGHRQIAQHAQRRQVDVGFAGGRQDAEAHVVAAVGAARDCVIEQQGAVGVAPAKEFLPLRLRQA